LVGVDGVEGCGIEEGETMKLAFEMKENNMGSFVEMEVMTLAFHIDHTAIHNINPKKNVNVHILDSGTLLLRFSSRSQI
jgi:hypothetical protein